MNTVEFSSASAEFDLLLRRVERLEQDVRVLKFLLADRPVELAHALDRLEKDPFVGSFVFHGDW